MSSSTSSGKGLFSSLAGKAQGFLNSHGSAAPSASNAAEGQTQYSAPAAEQNGSLGGRHHGLGAIQHQIRSLQVQYSSGTSQENRQLQMIITAQKGVSLDYDAAARDAKTHSKELYLWGQTQDDGIKDVTDRLAYLNYVQGSLSFTLATEVDKSRDAWKKVRDAEASLAPRRTIRQNLKAEMTKIQSSGGRTGNVDTKLQELDAQIKKVESDDAPLERELDLLRRSAIKESEAIKWKALREYGNKLVLLAGASEQLLNVLPSQPGPYQGQQQTAAVRAALQRALDSGYTPAAEHLPINTGAVSAEDIKSFGETHAHELSQISTFADSGHHGSSSAHPHPSTANIVTHTDSSHVINPAALNNTPAAIPAHNTPAHTYSPPSTNAPLHAPPGSPPTAYHAPGTAPLSAYAPPSAPPPGEPIPATAPVTVAAPTSQNAVPPHAPTVAETGVPVSAGAEGPGPAQGSLAHGGEKDETVHRPAYGYGVGSGDIPNQPPSAALQEAHLQASGSVRRPEVHHETAEEEKKRLEREERERVLRSDTVDSTKPSGDAPPAYAD